MQLITLTAPDGHQERWDADLLIHALTLLDSYLNNPNQLKENQLAQQVQEFVGDDPQQVHTALVYAISVKYQLFHKLALISNNGHRSMARIFFILRSMDKASGIHRSITDRPASDNPLIAVIKQVSNNDQHTIRRLADLTKLFVTGQLSYEKTGVNNHD